MSHTKGPWYWRISRKSRSVELMSATSGRPYVMAFRRYGMTGAQPQFNTGMIMIPAHDLAVDIPGQEHNNEWNQTISHPDAHLISAAPDMLEALEDHPDPRAFDGDGDLYLIAVDTWLAKARAAIKKARGGE